uniref:Uncharacterized protein n=1 Tax=Kalanchoe fedtschenkoi TaxID=63787 RepID=A0A7N0USZ8_KALFE
MVEGLAGKSRAAVFGRQSGGLLFGSGNKITNLGCQNFLCSSRSRTPVANFRQPSKIGRCLNRRGPAARVPAPRCAGAVAQRPAAPGGVPLAFGLAVSFGVLSLLRMGFVPPPGSVLFVSSLELSAHVGFSQMVL